MTPVVVKWNYNYRLLCLKTCNHYVVIAFVVFQLLQPWYTPTCIPMTIPICLRAMKTENTVVRSFLVVVRAKSPKMAAPAPAPTPEEKCPALTAYYTSQDLHNKRMNVTQAKRRISKHWTSKNCSQFVSNFHQQCEGVCACVCMCVVCMCVMCMCVVCMCVVCMVRCVVWVCMCVMCMCVVCMCVMCMCVCLYVCACMLGGRE